jgi:hypothetical protein
MSWTEWLVLLAGLALGYLVVSMLMGERKARERRGAGPGTSPGTIGDGDAAAGRTADAAPKGEETPR